MIIESAGYKLDSEKTLISSYWVFFPPSILVKKKRYKELDYHLYYTCNVKSHDHERSLLPLNTICIWCQNDKVGSIGSLF